MKIDKYSFGTGDRFGKEGTAQLDAIREMNTLGIPVVPVWNKSNREHSIIGSVPAEVRDEAQRAVRSAGYTGNYFVDADHINLETVDRFISSSDFFTIDVAHFIGKKASEDEVADFVSHHGKYRKLAIPGIPDGPEIREDFLKKLAENYLVALHEVKKIYDRIITAKGPGTFITEVSVDEAEMVQGPVELFFILAELKHLDVEVQTIAPKFSGLFAKGIDYIGDTSAFSDEFENDVAVVKFAISELGLADSLKLSVHSGSDKFSIYPSIKKAIQKFDTGIHVKTAGTTWLEEVIGLAEAGKNGLAMAKEIYAKSFERFDELAGPYATVLKIDRSELPSPTEVDTWSSIHFADALTHDTRCSAYNPHFRQLIHVGYKIAAEMGQSFRDALDEHHEIIASRVKHNLLEKHLKRLFL
ncbi:MAG TPA: tagaturonate epimerase family protein [Bacteroidales bacterium]|nr:tagaturonate epimerase family protein [Bacteroidales bacterium]